MSLECAEFDRRLQRQLDRRRSPYADRQLMRHARHCDACRQTLAAQALLCEHLALAARQATPPGMAARVLATWQSQSASNWHRARSWKYACALAAALLLATWQFGSLGGSRQPSNSGPAAPPGRVATQRIRPGAPQVRQGKLAADRTLPSGSVPVVPAANAPATRQRMELLAAETGQGLAAVVLQFPIVRSRSGVPGPAGPDQDSPWMESVTGSLKPFAESLSDAVAPWLEAAPQGAKSEG